jgi:hypothetical protein
MRNVIGIIVSLVAGFSINQAVAAPLANPGALKVAVEDAGVIEQVHCVPGWYHHDGGNSDGCGDGYYYGGGYYPGVYRGGYYGGGYRGGYYRGYRGPHVAHHRGGAYRGYRGGARVAHHGGARVAHRGGGGRAGGRGGGGRRSDMQLKHDIMVLGHLQNGIPFYRFAYTESDAAYVGVMAQDVKKVDPRAVTRGSDGYLRVHYERLGLKFQTYNEWLVGGGIVPTGRMR